MQRTITRAFISPVGDIIFDSTCYRSKEEENYHYLMEDILGFPAHKRFTEEAEVVLLTETLKTSYSEAAQALPSKQKITKTTGMSKVHGIASQIPFPKSIPKKHVNIYLSRQMRTTLRNNMGNGYLQRETRVSYVSRLMCMKRIMEGKNHRLSPA